MFGAVCWSSTRTLLRSTRSKAKSCCSSLTCVRGIQCLRGDNFSVDHLLTIVFHDFSKLLIDFRLFFSIFDCNYCTLLCASGKSVFENHHWKNLWCLFSLQCFADVFAFFSLQCFADVFSSLPEQLATVLREMSKLKMKLCTHPGKLHCQCNVSREATPDPGCFFGSFSFSKKPVSIQENCVRLSFSDPCENNGPDADFKNQT